MTGRIVRNGFLLALTGAVLLAGSGTRGQMPAGFELAFEMASLAPNAGVPAPRTLHGWGYPATGPVRREVP